LVWSTRRRVTRTRAFFLGFDADLGRGKDALGSDPIREPEYVDENLRDEHHYYCRRQSELKTA
jgi:hypothetical protein